MKYARKLKRYKVEVLVMEGDYGGQIYLTVPVKRIKCDDQAIRQLLSDLDRICWDDAFGADLYKMRQYIGDGLSGGMGGGAVTNGVWLHPHLEWLREMIEPVVAGTQPRIGSDRDLVHFRRESWKRRHGFDRPDLAEQADRTA